MKKRVLAMLLAAILTLGSAAPALAYETSDFSDVPASHWAYAPIMEMAEQGVMKGVGGDRFDPNGRLTAEMFLTLIGRAVFPDVEADGADWSGPYVAKAKEEGLLKDTAVTDETLKNEITRYDVAEILRSAVHHTQIKATIWTFGGSTRERLEEETEDKRELADRIIIEDDVTKQMPDGDSIPEEHKGAVRTVYAAGLMTGDQGGSFNGGSTLTRMEAAVILQRFLALRDGAALARELKTERVVRSLTGMTEKPLASLSEEELADLLYELEPEARSLLRLCDDPFSMGMDTNEFSVEEWGGILEDAGLSPEFYDKAYDLVLDRSWEVANAKSSLGDITAETAAELAPEEWGGGLYRLNELDDRDFWPIVKERGFTARDLIAAYRAADEACRQKVEAGESDRARAFNAAAQLATTAARMAQEEGIETLDITARGLTYFNELLGMHTFDNDDIQLGLYGEDGRLIGKPKLTGKGSAAWELDMTIDTSNWDEVFTLKLLEPYYWPNWFDTNVGYRITPERTGDTKGTITELVEGMWTSLRGSIYYR